MNSKRVNNCEIDRCVNELIGKMTIAEKCAQLVQKLGWKAYKKVDGEIKLTDEFKDLLSGNGLGSLYGVLRADPWTEVTLENGLSPEEGAEVVNMIQKYAIENTRHGIPLIIGEECSHGHMAIGATVFPVPLALASMWDVELYKEICSAISLETRSQGGNATFSPVLDVARDPRWGRIEETLGEDPYICKVMGIAAVEGLQDKNERGIEGIAATLKHFAAYGYSEGGHNCGSVSIGNRELHEVFLEPFKAAVEAGAASLMTAYHEIDGVPCTESKELLTDILREQWGFDGFVISDMSGIPMLYWAHHTAADLVEASARAINAGVDMDMGGDTYAKNLQAALNAGMISEKDVDRAVERVLKIKCELGLFENKFADPKRASTVIGCEKHRELAKKAALQTVILLENRNGLLPLKLQELCNKKIAVVGPNADNIYNQLGDYTSPQPDEAIVTVLDGMRQITRGKTEILYAKGCNINDPSTDGFAECLRVVNESDVVVAVVGGSSARDFGDDANDSKTGAASINERSAIKDMDCGEGYDRADLKLSGVQLELLKKIKDKGKKLVVVVISGRPQEMGWLSENADALLLSWYPGCEGGSAIAEIIFGLASPSGKLTVSIPKSAGQIPVYYNAKRFGRNRYLEMDSKPQYSFGYGLSYTEFKYSNPVVSPEKIGLEGIAIFSVDITNTGSMAADEIVQMYIKDDYSEYSRPAFELKGYRRIHLLSGETRKVEFEVGFEQLYYIGANNKRILELGSFTIMAGTGLDSLQQVKMEVIHNENSK